MRLRNKKTGEIINTFPHKHSLFEKYNSLAELNEEWEDYEEPKQYWFIATDGRVLECNEYANEDACWNGEKAIGNFFETREEAEKVVEKLKAWKRLKDKGFRFHDWKETTTYCLPYDWNESIKLHEIDKDLDLLFGGEE